MAEILDGGQNRRQIRILRFNLARIIYFTLYFIDSIASRVLLSVYGKFTPMRAFNMAEIEDNDVGRVYVQ